jgi:Spy/CpxP family protein refolding chaperone
MIGLRHAYSAFCLAVGLIGAAAYADTAAPAAPGGAAGGAGSHRWHAGHQRGSSEFRHVLRQVNLTPEQQIQIKAIFTQARPQMQELRTRLRTNHEALAATSPNDPNYPALLATEKANGITRIQAASDLKTQIYAVLTAAQQAQIPAIVAADRAARDARIAARRAQNAPS